MQPKGQRSQLFCSFTRYDKATVAQTWQVLRTEFDQMLLDNAREKGAEVREETTLNRLPMDDDRVIGVEATDHATGRNYEVRAPMTLDCTGKEPITSSRLGCRRAGSALDDFGKTGSSSSRGWARHAKPNFCF